MIYLYHNINEWVDFYHYKLVVFTHCGHTTVLIHRIKVIFLLHNRSLLKPKKTVNHSLPLCE